MTGFLPFFGDKREAIIKLITEGKVTFADPIWENVSEECKDLILQLLKVNVEERISASIALKSPWLEKFNSPPKISDKDLRMSINNLKAFRTQAFMQKAVLTFIASRQLTQKVEEKIRKIFDYYDTNKDGQISKEELIAGYKKLYGENKKVTKDVEHILSTINLNKNGNIGYNGILLIFLRLGGF